LIWFDLSVYYDLSSIQIHKALYKFLKSHWLHDDIDYVDIDTFLNNEKNGDTVWLHVLSEFTAVIGLFELNLSYKDCFLKACYMGIILIPGRYKWDKEEKCTEFTYPSIKSSQTFLTGL